jgi:hypothetical protein
MARVKNSALAGTALVPVADTTRVCPEREYDPHNVHTWLPLNGSGADASVERIMHGTLRKVYRGHANSAEAFIAAKLAVSASTDTLAITALRAEVIVPSDADDVYADPHLLGRLIDHAAARDKPTAALLGYWTVSEPDVAHLHQQWRRGRAIVEGLVDRFDVPMLVVQHAPSLAGNGNPPHLHVLAATRKLTVRGFSTSVTALIGDKARDVFVRAWNDAA